MKPERTFKVESIFEGANYVGVFSHKTGELINHIDRTQEEKELKDEPKETHSDTNKNQLILF